MNESLFRFVNSFAGRSVALDAGIIFFTDSAGLVLLFALLLCALHAFYHRRRGDALRIVEAFVVSGTAWFVGFVGKTIIAAPRPFITLGEVRELLAYGGNDAFPSGHATFYFALGTALFLYNKKLGVFVLAAAMLISLARVAAGIHWPGDVFAGVLLGITIAVIANRLVTYYTATR